MDPETDGEAEWPSAAEALDPETGGEAEWPPAAGSLEPEDGGEAEYSSKEEIEVLGIPENMLAYWMVLNSKKPFVSANEDCQEFFWDE